MTALLASCTVPRTTPRPVCAATGRAARTNKGNQDFIAICKKVPLNITTTRPPELGLGYLRFPHPVKVILGSLLFPAQIPQAPQLLQGLFIHGGFGAPA